MELGTVIGGKYCLEGKLGEGGMGVVYRAIHQHIEKPVAIKFLRSEHADDKRMLARFQQEARAASAVGHRNIIEVHDLGVTDEGAPYIVMELLSGQSLADALAKREGLETKRTAYIVCNILSALSAAHAASIIHRDLKPENIFLVDTGAAVGEVKLLDFGVSRVLRDDGMAVTTTGVVMGTPNYMSPEQAMGLKQLDQRSDLYAMGVILYQCLTGKLPFRAENYNALLHAIIQGSPKPPSVWRPGLNAGLEAVIMKALAREPEDRYQSACQMFDDLLPFVAEGSRDRIPLPTRSESVALASELPRITDDQAYQETRPREVFTKTSSEKAKVETQPTPTNTTFTAPPKRRSSPVALTVLLALALLSVSSFLLYQWAAPVSSTETADENRRVEEPINAVPTAKALSKTTTTVEPNDAAREGAAPDNGEPTPASVAHEPPTASATPDAGPNAIPHSGVKRRSDSRRSHATITPSPSLPQIRRKPRYGRELDPPAEWER